MGSAVRACAGSTVVRCGVLAAALLATAAREGRAASVQDAHPAAASNAAPESPRPDPAEAELGASETEAGGVPHRLPLSMSLSALVLVAVLLALLAMRSVPAEPPG
jgi:hypothetical protein